MVLVMKLLLKVLILLGGVKLLLVKDLVLNLGQQVIVLRFLPPPFPQISSQKLCFLREVTRRGALPTLLGDVIIILFHQPPILKTKGFISTRALRV
jgi:hypothetical protein